MYAASDFPGIDVIEGEGLDRLQHLSKLLSSAAGPGMLVFLMGPNREPIDIPESIYRVLYDAVKIFNSGDAVIVGALHRQLTTTEAANFLGISRQYLVRLIEKNEISCEMVGSHRRLRLGDVLAYKERRAVERRTALDTMAELDEELGAYD